MRKRPAKPEGSTGRFHTRLTLYCYGAVVNDQDVVTSGRLVAAASLIAVGPPINLTVNVVFLRRLTAGLIVAMVPAAFKVTATTMTSPFDRVSVAVAALTPVTGSLNVAVMLAPRATLVALATGTVAVTVGATLATGPPPVVNVHEVVASDLHVATRFEVRIPVDGHEPPAGLKVTVYCVLGDSGSVGLIVTSLAGANATFAW